MQMQKKYLITLYGKEIRRSIVATYHNQHLRAVAIPETEKWDATALMWMGSFIRHIVTENRLHEYQQDTTKTFNFRLNEVPQKLDFDTFWDAYAYKVGNKGKAANLWKLLDEEDKIKALCGIKNYNYFLQLNPNTDKIYPERYLSQRRFENEYK